MQQYETINNAVIGFARFWFCTMLVLGSPAVADCASKSKPVFDPVDVDIYSGDELTA